MRLMLITVFCVVSAASGMDCIVILGGELGSRRDIMNVASSFDELEGFTALPVFYHSRHGIDRCRDNLKRELRAIDFRRYDRVHFFCFILGGMVLSSVIDEVKPENTGRIIVLKSPLEEYLPIVSASVYPAWAIRLAYGRTVRDIAKQQYTMFGSGEPVGLIIETKPNPLAMSVRKRMVKKFGADALVPLPMHPDSLFTRHNDYLYIDLHHNDMYRYPERYVTEAAEYFRTGRFSVSADREVREPACFFPRHR